MHELEQAWLESLELEGSQSTSSKRLNHSAQTLVFEHLFVVNKELPKIGKIPTEEEENNRDNPHPTDKTGFVFHNRYDIDRKMKEFKNQDEKYHHK